MNNEKLQSYLDSLLPSRNELLVEMEVFAENHGVPIMERTGIEILLQVLRLHDAKRILEVGTAIGYSALRMGQGLPASMIVSIERNNERFKLAEDFVSRSGISERIHLVNADALEAEEAIKAFAPFDAIFIDAAKGQYKRFFEMYSRYLSEEGIIITDNVLFKGLLFEERIENRRVRSLVKKINEFNHWLMSHPDYDTVILPIGDGVAISKKRGDGR